MLRPSRTRPRTSSDDLRLFRSPGTPPVTHFGGLPTYSEKRVIAASLFNYRPSAACSCSLAEPLLVRLDSSISRATSDTATITSVQRRGRLPLVIERQLTLSTWTATSLLGLTPYDDWSYIGRKRWRAELASPPRRLANFSGTGKLFSNKHTL